MDTYIRKEERRRKMLKTGINLFIGCSDAGMFTLTNDKSVEVLRFSGATAKGLGRGNRNSEEILRAIACRLKLAPIKSITWVFGSVDVKFSAYYRICEKNEAVSNLRDSMMSCAVKYMEFIRKVHAIVKSSGCESKIIVLGVEPNGAPPNIVYRQCLKYKVLSDTEENVRRVGKAVDECHPDLLRRSFNDILKQMCDVSEFRYIDIDEYIVNECGLKDYKISMTKPEFADIVSSCVHLNWEKNLVLYLLKLKEIGIDIKKPLDLDRKREKYIGEKLKDARRMDSWIKKPRYS